MNVREMHMELNQSLQKVAANKTRKYLTEEIDWVLNKIQNEYIRTKLKPKDGGGYSIDELDVDAIRSLLKKKTIDAFIKPSEDGYFCPLPADYTYLISDASITNDLCGREAILDNKTLYITWLKASKSVKNSAPYYQAVDMAIDTVNTLNIPANLGQPNQYKGYQRPEDISFLVDWIQDYYNKQLISCTWEKYGHLYKPGCFGFPSTTGLLPATLSYDGIPVTAITTQTIALKIHTKMDGSGISANRLSSSEKVANMRDTAFYKSSARTPISELIGNTLFIYADTSFIVSSCEVTYIRKPQPISLALGSDCELAPEVHYAICDLAAEYIMGTIGDGNQRSLIERDIQTRVIL